MNQEVIGVEFPPLERESMKDSAILDPGSSGAPLTVRLNRYLEFDRINGAYLDWQFEQFRSYVGERVLEIGCGVGGIIARLRGCSAIHGLDVEEDVLAAAKMRFANRPECQFSLLDLSTCPDSDIAQIQEARFDTVIAINVLEHVKDDVQLLNRIGQILVPGGHLLLLVPAHQWLYGSYDELDGHFRRYSRQLLKNSVATSGLEIVRMRYFNLLGALGWWFHYRLLNRKMHGSGQFRMMNRLIPWQRIAERVVSPPFGLSLVAILRKPLPAQEPPI